jgi:hypothetical protein
LGWPLALLLVLPAVSHFLKMLGWRALLPGWARPSLPRAYATFVAAQGVNELGFSVLGEPLKVMVLPRAARAAGVRAVLADNAAAFAALLAVIATLAYLRAWAALPLALAVICARWVGSARWSALLTAFVAHYLGKLWLVAEIALGLRFLGQPAASVAAPLALVWMGASAVGAPVPAQLGVVEAALLHAGAVLGVAAPSLVALALVRRLRSLLWLLFGLLLAAWLVSRKNREERHVSITTP